MARAEREQLMLNAAGQIFARGGYHSASMDEIAALAGVSKPLLYAYFNSKEGLYTAYITRTGRDLLDRLAQSARHEGHTLACLRARITEFLAFVEDYRDAWIVLYREMTASRPIADEVAGLRRQIVEAVQHMLEADASAPRAASGRSAAAMAHAIVGAGESLANWWLEHPEVPRDDLAEVYMEVAEPAFAAAFRHRIPKRRPARGDENASPAARSKA